MPRTQSELAIMLGDATKVGACKICDRFFTGSVCDDAVSAQFINCPGPPPLGLTL
jgi:hypothetical protein